MEENVQLRRPEFFGYLMMGLNVFKFDNIDKHEKLVLACLWSHSSMEGTGAFPKVETIAHETGLSVSTVKKSNTSLEKKGFIKRVANFRPQAPGQKPAQTANSYELFVPLSTEQARNMGAEEETPSRDATPGGGRDTTPGGPQDDPGGGRGTATNNLSLLTSPLTKDIDKAPPTFQDFWDKCPNQSKKKRAVDYWDKAIKRKVNPQDILDGYERYLAYAEVMYSGPQYVMNPATFLNNEEWMGEWKYEERQVGFGRGRNGRSSAEARDLEAASLLPSRQRIATDEEVEQLRRELGQLPGL